MSESPTGRRPSEPNDPLRFEPPFPGPPITSNFDYGAAERRLVPSLGWLWFQGKLPSATSHDAMRALIDTFPSLADFPGEWDAMDFSKWAKQSLSHGGLCAAAFVLSVWNPNENKKPPRGSPHRGLRWDMHESFGVWDNEHRAAFVAWCREPWWP